MGLYFVGTFEIICGCNMTYLDIIITGKRTRCTLSPCSVYGFVDGLLRTMGSFLFKQFDSNLILRFKISSTTPVIYTAHTLYLIRKS